MNPRRMEAERKARMRQVRENDRKHDEKMTVIAARGGKTLAQLRSMSKVRKDEFISFYRDGGPWEKAA